MAATDRSAAAALGSLGGPARRQRQLEMVISIGGVPVARSRGVWNEDVYAGRGGISPPLTEQSRELVDDPVIFQTTDGCFTFEHRPVATSTWRDGDGNEIPFYSLEGQS
jgi:hypothetical protein